MGACTWLGVAVSESVVIGYKGFLIIGWFLSGLIMCTQHTLQIYTMFLYQIQIVFTHKNWLHNKYMTWQHIQPVNLCSRDTASRDHAFPSGLLATPTTVSKTHHGQCVNRVKQPLLRLFSSPKWYMKTYFGCIYAIIGIIYTV